MAEAVSLNWTSMERAREREDPSMPDIHKYRVQVTPRDVPQKVWLPHDAHLAKAIR